MFNICIKYNEIVISNIEKNDMEAVHSLCNNQKLFLYKNENYLEYKELYQRFLEYYVSECEFFLKIIKKDKLVGILKGRIEFKTSNIVWISCFVIEHVYLENNEGEIILRSFLNYFSDNFGICSFLAGVATEDKELLKILKNNGFQLERVSQDFFMSEGKECNAIILKKEQYV